jgi:hypothetical protein
MHSKPNMRIRKNVPLDSIRLSDPAILADQKTKMYYMTGTGGMMWRSADLKLWEGPYRVTEFEAHQNPDLSVVSSEDTIQKNLKLIKGPSDTSIRRVKSLRQFPNSI